MKLPSYLRLSRHGIYTFRRRIPDDLASRFEGAEVRLSLATSDRQEAVRRARAVAAETDAIFQQTRHRRLDGDFPPYWAAERVRKLLRARLMTSETVGPSLSYGPGFELLSEAAAKFGLTERKLLAALLDFKSPVYLHAQSWRGWLVDRLSDVETDGHLGQFIESSYQHLGWETACTDWVRPFDSKEALAALVERGEFEESVFRVGEHGALFLGMGNAKRFTPHAVYLAQSAIAAIGRPVLRVGGFGPDAPPVTTLKAQEPPAPLLSVVIENKFFAASEIERRADKPATVRKDRDALRLFLAIVGDKPIRLVGQSDAKKFADEIPHFRARDQRAASTCNGHMASVSKFCEWVRGHHSEYGVASISFKTLRRTLTARPDELRAEFKNAELHQIFNHPKIRKFAEHDLPKFWMLHIGLYTGMRAEEICQLHPQADFLNVSGIEVIQVQEGEGQSLKNRSSRRKVPIHPQLLKLGLLDYVEALRRYGATRLFPDTTVYEGRHAKNLGKTVNRFIQKNVGIEEGSNHCFRHTLNNYFKQNRVPEELAAAITGHGYGGITYKVYGKEYEPPLLFDIVKEVDYGLKHVRPASYRPAA